MAAQNFTFGLTGASGFTQSFDVTGKMDEKMIVDKDGTFAQAYCYNPTYDITVNGVGDLPIDVAATSVSVVSPNDFGAAVYMVTGTTVTEKADDFPSFTLTIKGYKSGVTVEKST
jgi:hypothetical protein